MDTEPARHFFTHQKFQIKMTIKRKKKTVDPRNYILAIHAAKNQLAMAKKRIKTLDAEYIKNFCNWSIGQEVPIPVDKNPPYTWFKIEKINVRYDEVDLDEDQKEFNIFFVYDGKFFGDTPEVESLQGSLKIESSKTTGNGKEKQESAEVVE